MKAIRATLICVRAVHNVKSLACHMARTPARQLSGSTKAAHTRVDDELGNDYSFPEGLSPLQAYEWLHRNGKVKRDNQQLRALQLLDSLHGQIARSGEGMAKNKAEESSSPGVFGGLFGAVLGFGKASGSSAGSAGSGYPPPRVKGLYMYGGPGCGKTFMMDIFYRCVPTSRKRRAHFHSFMLDIHARLHAVRQRGYRGDPVPVVADELASNSWLICFDEMQVTDVGDAMIMRRLFTSLFQKGLVVVATSNRAPRELYYNGLQRELFLPFIDLIEEKCVVHDLESETDYRLLATPLTAGSTWITPGDAAGKRRLEEIWQQHIGHEPVASATLTTQGRIVRVDRCVERLHTARFHFNDLCAKPLGSADYQVLAQHFGKIFIDDVPKMTLSEKNELRRFITLIDTLYEHRVKLVATAATLPPVLFNPVDPSETNADVSRLRGQYDEVFAFDRTVSRLMEMQSEEYLEAEWRPRISTSGTLESEAPVTA